MTLPDPRSAAGYSPAALFSSAARSSPYAFYRWLRAEAPVCAGGPMGAYVISRYADVAAALRDTFTFSSAIMSRADPVLLGADPPAHRRVREAVARALGEQQPVAMEPLLRERARTLIHGMRGAPIADLIGDFATPLPVFALASLLGLPAERHGDLRQWADAIVAASTGMADQDATVGTRLLDMRKFLTALIAEHSGRAPTDEPDFLAALLHGPTPLTGEEVASVVALFIVAGSETTTHLIGNAVLALAQAPEQMARVRADRSRLARIVDEVLRYDSPVQVVQRICRTPTVVSGVSIPAGSPVLLLLGSANRDETQFAEPDVFDPDRRERTAGLGHLAFGAGPHACVGAMLARLQATVALDELLTHLPVLSLPADEDRPMTRAVQLRGWARIRLAFPAS